MVQVKLVHDTDCRAPVLRNYDDLLRHSKSRSRRSEVKTEVFCAVEIEGRSWLVKRKEREREGVGMRGMYSDRQPTALGMDGNWMAANDRMCCYLWTLPTNLESVVGAKRWRNERAGGERSGSGSDQRQRRLRDAGQKFKSIPAAWHCGPSDVTSVHFPAKAKTCEMPTEAGGGAHLPFRKRVTASDGQASSRNQSNH